MNLFDQVSKIWDKPTKLDTWLESLEKSKEPLALLKKQFHQWGNLRVYTSTTKAKAHVFSLRFFGQEVAQLFCKESIIKIKLCRNNVHNKELFEGLELKGEEYVWNSKEGKKFRSFFKNSAKESYYKPGIKSEEHRIESKFIVEMLRRTQKFGIAGLKIKPVTISGIPLQIPVPISASGIEPKVGNGYIDILARHKGKDNKDRLCVWELKRTETYGHPVSQVYIYAATLLKILRYSKNASRWYKLFGFNRKLPKSIEIEAVVAVSPSKRNDFEEELNKLKKNNVPFKIDNDCIHIYSAYYIEQPNSCRITFQTDPFI